VWYHAPRTCYGGNSRPIPAGSKPDIGACENPRSKPLTGVDGRPDGLPTSFTLEQNYPNPFNPSTTITFELPKASMVRLTVYDMLGREVAVIVNERRDAGVHEVRFDGSGLSSGVYLYRLQAGEFVRTLKSVLLQ